jgi:hypothetical protein
MDDDVRCQERVSKALFQIQCTHRQPIVVRGAVVQPASPAYQSLP